jgi:hypothetical protein
MGVGFVLILAGSLLATRPGRHAPLVSPACEPEPASP